MVERNGSLKHIVVPYLFVEIAKRRAAHLKKYPDAPLLSLGIGDTTEPIPSIIADEMAMKAAALGTKEGYQGYGDPFGPLSLREKIAHVLYGGKVGADEIFISDGSKCDIGRLQFLFGPGTSIALQDPAYPVYGLASLISGKKAIHYMPCKEEDQFLPDIQAIPKVDLIYLCSPNNPTGALFSKRALQKVILLAKERGSIIIYDAAYASYIREEGYPRSIFELEGASEVAIETNSLSKLAGFTGVRLGWTVVPSSLKFSDGTPVQKDWRQVMSSLFNGPSNIATAGAVAALSPQGLLKCRELQDHYLKNAKTLKTALEKKGYSVFGGTNAPFLFLNIKGQSSWALFDYLLETAHLITTPGAGFGPSGEGYLRLSSFGSSEQMVEAANRLSNALK